MATPSNGNREAEYYRTRLDDVNKSVADLKAQVARIEGRLESVATKEDVANAKFALVVAWSAALLTALIAVVTFAIRFWPA